MKMYEVLFFITVSIVLFSLTQCCTSQNTDKERKEITNIKDFARPLPYGSAKVSCMILGKYEKDGKIFCVAQIDTVLGYGSGTKPIGVGSTMDLELSEKLLSKSTKSQNEIFKINSRQKLLLAYMHNGINQNEINPWKIISNENN